MNATKMSKLCISAQWLRKLALASCQPDGDVLCARLTPIIRFKSSPHLPPPLCLQLLRNCNHFANEFVEKLTGKGIPHWVSVPPKSLLPEDAKLTL